MRFLIGADVPPDPNSGAAGDVYCTNSALRDLGHDVDEIWRDDLPQRIRHGNLHYLLELPRGYRDAVRQRCALGEYDAIVLSQPHAYLAAKDHRRSGRPGVFVNRSHGLEPRIGRELSMWRRRLRMPANRFPRSILSGVIRRLLARQWSPLISATDGFLVQSTDDERYLVDDLGVSRSRVAVLRSGLPHEFLTRPPQPLTDDRLRRLLHVAQYSFFKGPVFLKEIVTQLFRTDAISAFTWVCSAQHHETVRGLFPADLQSRIHLLDWMPQEELTEVYDAHGLFVFPTIAEGFAKSFHEAMSRGLCVVASDTSGMRDTLQTGDNGFAVPVGGTDGFVERLTWLAANPAEARRVGATARASVGDLTWARCAEVLCSFCTTLQSGFGRTGP